MNLRSPLSKADGLGSAQHGFSHWWLQRLSAVALIPLSLWFIYALLCNLSGEHASAIAWLSSPLNASLMLMFVLTAIYHAQTGLQVVIEDYVHTHWLNLLMLISIKFAAVAMAVLATLSILKIFVGA